MQSARDPNGVIEQVDTRNEHFPLTVIVLTKNEAINIADCLRSVEWADDLIVVDSESTDTTVRAAKAACDRVRVFSHPFVDFGEQRNWALDSTEPRHPWILFLDADERIPSNCAAAIQDAVANPGGAVGYYLCCRNIFLGRWIKRCTFFPSWQLRLLEKGSVRYRREGHGQREVTDGPLEFINEPYDHFAFSKGVADWIDRHNRYSSDELELIVRLRREPLAPGDLARGAVVRRRCLKRLAARVGFRPLARFLYTYVWRGGFLDGHAGFLFCLLRVTHEIHITVKLAERNAQRGDKVISEQKNVSSLPTYSKLSDCT